MSAAEDRPPEPPCEPFQRYASEMRIARRIEARRPYCNRGLAGCDSQVAAADAALSGKADPVGKFPGAVIVAAGQHHRIDAPRAFGGDNRVAGSGIAAEMGEKASGHC